MLIRSSDGAGPAVRYCRAPRTWRPRLANRTDGPARFLLILSPPGHDRYFDELAEILAVEGPPGDAIAELRRRYDTEQISSLTDGRT